MIFKFLFLFFFLVFREPARAGVGGGRQERNRNQGVVASGLPPSGYCQVEVAQETRRTQRAQEQVY